MCFYSFTLFFVIVDAIEIHTHSSYAIKDLTENMQSFLEDLNNCFSILVLDGAKQYAKRQVNNCVCVRQGASLDIHSENNYKTFLQQILWLSDQDFLSARVSTIKDINEKNPEFFFNYICGGGDGDYGKVGYSSSFLHLNY